MRGPLDLLLHRQVKPGEDFARNTWECTGCGACEEVCPVDIPFDKLWDDVKEWMVKSGFERKELEPYLTNVRETHNLFGEPTEARGAWIPPEAVQSANPEVLYWVGCVASYKRQQIARAVVKILNAARVPYMILGADALCSGAGGGFPAVFPEQAAGVAQRRLDAAEDTGAAALVTTCPHAEMHFEGVARQRNMTLSIIDLAEMLANAL